MTFIRVEVSTFHPGGKTKQVIFIFPPGLHIRNNVIIYLVENKILRIFPFSNPPGQRGRLWLNAFPEGKRPKPQSGKKNW